MPDNLNPTLDLVLRNARVIDPSQNINAVLDVGVSGGKIAAIGESLGAGPASDVRDLSGKYLSPGLIDLHGHWYGGSTFGIDPAICLKTGVTTAVDAGTTGFLNFDEFRRDRLEASEVQLLAYLNISAIGIPAAVVGELFDIRYARPKETAALIEKHREVLLGVKVRIGERMSGANGKQALALSLEAAEAIGVPMMVHFAKGADTPVILRRLRPGDVITHCYQGRGDTILADDSIIPEALAARRNGVLFDVGHGCGSFSFETAKKAFEYFFLPDTISTDLHRFSVERFAFDMPTTMSKFLHLGMSLEEVILKSTWNPAKAIRREDELGTLRVGTVADIFVFEIEDGAFDFEDTHCRIEKGSQKIVPSFLVRGGKVIEPSTPKVELRELYEWDQEVFRLIKESS